MSRDSVVAFIQSVRDDAAVRGTLAAADPAEVVALARSRGFEFAEDDLRRVLKETIYAAGSLPQGWGWPLARRMGLVN